MSGKTYDFAVIGAGCFGAWTAHALLNAGHGVVLVDAYGPAHSRASSGGESRIIRMGYGADELYTRWAQRSLAAWRELDERTRAAIFHRTGMLWLAGTGDAYTQSTLRTLEHVGVAHRRLDVRELDIEFPQISLDGIEWALHEPESGVLMARRAVQTLVANDRMRGLDFRTASVEPPAGRGKLARMRASDGTTISAGAFIFACGAWLPRVFPDVLARRIFPTRQEVYFFATPPGDEAFAPPAMPAWFHHPALVYGIPDLEHRGFKISIDRHGPPFDPDTGSRLPSEDGLAEARAYLARRFPKLRDAVLTESRVCQYENTHNGDFVIDRHPELADVVIVGGGSGHGFKHGPAVGEHAAALATGGAAAEPRFALASTAAAPARTVF
ncbi:MAG TPA: FAD-dependent oxidoreductase [Rudaea sp.]|nr:FAD-dependent oxidoreductase [Rudaea sp.]